MVDGDIDREVLLNALLACDLSKPMGSSGVGGTLFQYVNVAEAGGFVKHPDLAGGSYAVRDSTDMQWLMDEQLIQVRQWDRAHRSFTFELTKKALHNIGK